MIYVYLTVVIILLITLKPKYLGIFSCISLENVLSHTMVMNVRYSILIAFAIWTIYQYINTSEEGYQNASTSYADSQNRLAGNDTSAPDTYNYDTYAGREPGDSSTDELWEEQKEKLCKPDSDLTAEQRTSLCDSDSGTLSISPGGAMDEWKEKMENLKRGDTNGGVQPSPLYNESGTVKYGGTGYVPSYEQAAYNNDFKFKTEPNTVAYGQNEGFCKDTDMFGQIEKKCNSLTKDVCATTSCCVLVGGEKCVHGNENGPKQKSIYSDTSIKNRDVYYYQGKCYGNCM